MQDGHGFGFGSMSLESVLVKGNLSLIPSDDPFSQGDGSLELPGKVYTNEITEYSFESGVRVQNAIFGQNTVVIPHTAPVTSSTSAAFVIHGGVSVMHTSNSVSALSGDSALAIAGGVRVGKRLCVGGGIDAGLERITSVATPIDGTDAVNKDFLDSYSFGNLQGLFTHGQVLIAGSTESNVVGFPSFTYNDVTNVLSLVPSTTGSISLDVGLGRITSVADPIDGKDAVNKDYLDAYFASTSTSSTPLDLNVTSPTDVPFFTFRNDSRAGIQYVYVHTGTGVAVFELTFWVDAIGEWNVSTTFTGGMTGVDFTVRTLDDGGAQVQYTNTNTSGVSTARYREFTSITTSDLVDTVNSGSGTLLLNTGVSAARYYIYCTFGLTVLDSVLVSDNTYRYAARREGSLSTVVFSVNPVSGNLEYTNTNPSTGDPVGIFIKKVSVDSLESPFTLAANTNVKSPTPVTVQSFQETFHLLAYVTCPRTDAGGMYEISGILGIDSSWIVSSKFIGDVIPGLKWTVNSGTLEYTNISTDDYSFIYIVDTFSSSQWTVMPVNKGGTGLDWITPGAVMRGNGDDPVVANSDLMFTSGTLIVNGKTYTTGLDARQTRVTNVADPIDGKDAVNKDYFAANVTSFFDDSVAILGNDVTVFRDIPDFWFAGDVCAFTALISVRCSNGLAATFTVKSTRHIDSVTWTTERSFIGGVTGVDFSVYTNTQLAKSFVQYTNSDGTNESTVRWTVLQTIGSSNSTITFASLNLNLIETGFALGADVLSAKILARVAETGSLFVIDATRVGTGAAFASNASVLNWQGPDSDIRLEMGADGKLRGTGTGTSTVISLDVSEITESNAVITLGQFNATVVHTYTPSQLMWSLSVYVYNSSVGCTFDLVGSSVNDTWVLNTRSYGDYLGTDLTWNIQDGILVCENSSATVYYSKQVSRTLQVYTPLPVIKGGTGKDYFAQGQILVGNGTERLSSTAGLKYTGTRLTVNGNDITPNTEDFTCERAFAFTGTGSFQISGFALGQTVRSFSGHVCVVTSVEGTETAVTAYTVTAYRKNGVFTSSISVVGDTMATLSLYETSGQFAVTIPDGIPETTAITTVKYRGLTTTV